MRPNKIIFGIDEVGRGSLVGPVVACALVIQDQSLILKLKKECNLKNIRDSKKTTIKKRGVVFNFIKQHMDYSFGSVDARIIDEINIHHATLLAMKKALDGLVKKTKLKPDLVLIDGIYKIPGIAFNQRTIIGGDDKITEISLASIAAKVYRDKKMVDHFHTKHPKYKIDQHKGYGTAEHIKILKKIGPSSDYRKSFVTKILNKPL